MMYEIFDFAGEPHEAATGRPRRGAHQVGAKLWALARELSDVCAQLVPEYEMYLPDTSDFQFCRHSDL